MPFTRGDHVRVKSFVPIAGDEEYGFTALRMVGLTGYVTSVDEWDDGLIVVDFDAFPHWLLGFAEEELELIPSPV